MEKIKVGLIGTGYIGESHIDAIRRLGYVELAAVADADFDLARSKAERYGVEKCYRTAEELIADKEIRVVHNCTPNHLHLVVNEMVIEAGKHIFSEKPLAKSSQESARMLQLLKAHPDVVAGVNFCYRMNALVQDAKNRIADGEIGTPYLVHGAYLQDWLLYETDYNWRIEPEYTGASRCVGDIGSHWMDTAQTLIGSRITEVCANTVIALPKRKKPTTQVETFSQNTDVEYETVDVKTEDYAGVLVKFENGASGLFQCSEISAGRKCFIDIEVDGSIASFQWQQETSDQMWKGNRDKNNEQVMRNPNLMTAAARQYAHLAAGHPEGWNDAFRNNLDAFYSFLRAGKKTGVDPCDFATFEEGHYIMRLTEAIMKSGTEKRWVKVTEV
ncbi:Gfo/Idh/MocA family oxidoreductase [Christensenellaceae bacterium OttesenSCG-928-K19]|nr:Gfo/Idh/MocA family oxidoreductase [Christensenellaceae bacterium OttesenSCG-928-K19]